MDLSSWLDANRSDTVWHREDSQRRHGGKDAVFRPTLRETLHLHFDLQVSKTMRGSGFEAERNIGEVDAKRQAGRSLLANPASTVKSFAFGEANLRDAQARRTVAATGATKHDGDSWHGCFENHESEY